jgi:16S rRNA (cytidine1402-2'-O)-methyltransferase
MGGPRSTERDDRTVADEVASGPSGTLYLVATPIGNLQDMTVRAVETLRAVALIAAEDTRHSRVLLDHYGIKTKLVSYHEHNERERAVELADRLVQGDSIAVSTDAGMPGIADPGFRLVGEAAARGIRVVPIPGASAFVSALAVSGLPTDAVFFGGFLPSRTGARRSRLESLKDLRATLVFYEAPHRLVPALVDAREILGDRAAVVARELTKLHEEILRGRLSELGERFTATEPRGEIVLLISGVPDERQSTEGPPIDIAARVAELELEGLDPKAALKRAAKEMGLTRSEAYRRLLAAKADRS